MIGIIIQLLLSWIIVYFLEKKDLSVLGFSPTIDRIKSFILFLLLTSLFCSLGFVLKMYFGKQHWILNPALDAKLLLSGIWWNLKSVLFEELIFRGVLLYILIKKLGAVKAIIISAAAFGIYHWFSFGVLGNPLQMLSVFVITGLMGVLLAFGYARSFSLYIPVGIHMGWNFTQIFVFSNGPIGNGIFIQTGHSLFRTDSLALYLFISLTPVLLALLINFLLIRNLKQSVIS